MRVQSYSFIIAVACIWILAMSVRRVAWRRWVMLGASLAFYATWGLGFLGVLSASALGNFLLGRWIARRPQARPLAAGIGFNVLLLAAFRFIPTIASDLAEHPVLNVAVPVGISFWTFQAISYLFDLYREEELDPTFPEFLLYMSFFPTVLSGPVCRLPEMLPQFRSAPPAVWADIAEGTQRIVIGLFMKVVLASLLGVGFNAGEGVDAGFEAAGRLGGLDVWLLAIGFGFQLFFDFAGYSNIVIGVARLFGIRVRENFDHPYLSTTPSVFWTRWHMSLSFWIRDYVFMPLATLRRGRWWKNVSLILAMTLFGLWHGPAATYIAWGLYQGCILVGHREFERVQKRRGWRSDRGVGAPVGWGITFLLVSFGWIFFRAPSFSSAVSMVRAVFTPSSYLHLSLRPNYVIVLTLLVGGYFAFVWLARGLAVLRRNVLVDRVQWVVAPVGWAVVLLGIIIFSSEGTVFIYFQF